MKGVFTHPGNGNYLTPGTPISQSVLVEIFNTSGVETFSTSHSTGGWVYNIQQRGGLGFETESAMLAVNPGGIPGCLLSINIDKIGEPNRAKGGLLNEDE